MNISNRTLFRCTRTALRIAQFASVLTICLGLICPHNATAQAARGRIVGSVTDQSGAAIPEAKVTVTNEGTAISRVVSSGPDGSFNIPLLESGRYSVRVEKAGFESEVTPHVLVEVARETRVDFSLQVGAVTQQIEVTATAPLLQTTDATIGHVVPNKSIVDLPLRGRNFLELAVLTPGAVVPSGAANIAARQGARFVADALPSVAGHRPQSLTVTLDGFLNTRPWDQTPVIRPSIDALQEFKIQTSSTSAETVRNVVGIAIATKSGTNELHGTLFEFLRNDAFDARSFWDTKISPLRQNQFGLVIGGPIVIPKIYNGKEKTFFFGNWESNRIRLGRIRTGNFPTEAMRQGDLSDLRDSSGNLILIYDPTTTDPVTGERQPFPGNIIPSAQIDPTVKKMLDFYPPTTDINDFPNTVRALSDTTDSDMITGRVDHQFGNNNLLARFGWQQNLSYQPSLVKMGGWNIDQISVTTGLAWTRSFSPNLFNVARLAFLTSRTYQVQDAVKANRNLNAEVGVKNVSQFDRIAYALPGLTFWGGNYEGIGGPQSFKGVANSWQYEDTLTYVRGKHTMNFGGLVYHSRTAWGSGGATGYYNYNGQYTAQLGSNFTLVPGTGHQFADALAGETVQAFLTNNGGLGDYFDTSYFAYFSDTWRATPKLTLNYGLNWQYIGPFIEKYGRMSFPDFSPASFAMGGRQINTCRPIDAYNPIFNPGNNFTEIIDESLCIRDPGKGARYYDNFAPRFGLSYRLTEKTVLRLGGGLFYDFYQQASQMAGMTGDPPYPIFYSLYSANPLRSDYPQSSLFPSFDQMAADTSGRVVGPKLNDRFNPYVEQWNLSIQRQFSPNVMLEAGYIGSAGHHLELNYSWNMATPDLPGERTPIGPRQPFPNFGLGLLALEEMVGNSNYHAGYVKFEKRFSRGLAMQASYTYSAALGWGGTDFWYAGGSGGTWVQNARCLKCEYSRLDEDVPHRFVINALYELPFGRGRTYLSNLSGAANHLLGGWQANVLTAFQSGAPYSIFDYDDTGNIGGGGRASYSSGHGSSPPTQDFRKTGFAFDPSYFASNQQWQAFGTLGRNTMRGGGINNWDISLFKNFRIREATSLQFRTEFYSAFNHAQFTQPNNNVDSMRFGQYRPGSARPGRIIQFSLKLFF